MSYDDLQLNTSYFIVYKNPNHWFINVYTDRREHLLKGKCIHSYNPRFIGEKITTDLEHWQTVTVCLPLNGSIDNVKENYPELFL